MRSWSKITGQLSLAGVVLAVGGLAGCAAQDESDDPVGAGGQAATLDEAVARTAAMKERFEGVRVQAQQDLPFDDKAQPTRWIAAVGISGGTMCVLALLPGSPSTTAVLPKVPKGDIYAFDARKIALARKDGFLVWSFPMNNEKVQAGASGKEADFVLECSGKSAPEISSIEMAFRRGWRNQGGEPLLSIAP